MVALVSALAEALVAAQAELPERLTSKYVIDGASGCWNWTASTDGRGYGRIQMGRVTAGGHRAPARAHRVMYELLVGEIPVGLQIDHLCRNRRCVNPAHLEVVTSQENTRRGYDTGFCRHGHERTETNTYARPDGRIECRDCRVEREAA